jgi:molybdopterin converting factor subunit 1
MDGKVAMKQVFVLMFASIKDAAGVEVVKLRASTVADVARELADRFPNTRRLIERSRFAVNQQFAELDTQLTDGDEVAVLPPVSGG